MAKLFIICGHGAGDPGCCAGGCTEAERVRALGQRIKELGGSEVELGDTSRNWYADGGLNRLSTDAPVVELHMDASGIATAHGAGPGTATSPESSGGRFHRRALGSPCSPR